MIALSQLWNLPGWLGEGSPHGLWGFSDQVLGLHREVLHPLFSVVFLPLSGVFCFLRFSLAIAEVGTMDRVDLRTLGRYVGLEVAFYSLKIGLGANTHIFNVQPDKYNEHCCMLHMKVVKRVNPKHYHNNKNFFLLHFVCIWDEECLLSLLW